jgi:hypothetical protein
MTIAHNIQDIHFKDDQLILNIDGRVFAFSFEKFSDKLKNANEEERSIYKVSPSGYGIHWPLIDEDISIDALLKSIAVD